MNLAFASNAGAIGQRWPMTRRPFVRGPLNTLRGNDSALAGQFVSTPPAELVNYGAFVVIVAFSGSVFQMKGLVNHTNDSLLGPGESAACSPPLLNRTLPGCFKREHSCILVRFDHSLDTWRQFLVVRYQHRFGFLRVILSQGHLSIVLWNQPERFQTVRIPVVHFGAVRDLESHL